MATATVSVALGVLLVSPAAVAAASPTYGFSASSPTPSTVNYSDYVTLKGAFTCLDGPDSSSTCPSTSLNAVATFALRPTGGTTFTNVASASVFFTFSTSGCPTTCSVAFQVQWRAGRASGVTVPPGTYDVGLTTTLTGGQDVLPAALVITPESTTTTYTGGTSGDAGAALALNASVMDADRGLLAGTGMFFPDVNLGAATAVTFSLYDSTNTTLVAGPVSATVSSSGGIFGSPTLTLPAPGTYELRTVYLGNDIYTSSADLSTITSISVNTPPVLSLPGPMTVEATSAAGAVVQYGVSATDAEDVTPPVPACSPASGSTFPLGTTTVDCSATDSGGLTTTGGFDVSVVDTTPPVVTVSTSESAGSSGWYDTASNDATPGVTIDVTASDVVGLASLSCTDDGVPVAGLGPSGGSFVVGDGSHDVACTASDAAGNQGAGTGSFDVDQTPPTNLSFVGGGLVDGGSYLFGAVPDGPTSCTADFGVSGPGGCVVSAASSLVGDQLVTATATDLAGNVATAQLHYTVVPWTLVGFAKPIDMTGVNNDKAGHQVRLKFQVWAGATQLTNPGVVADFTETQVSCPSGALGPTRPATTRSSLDVDPSGNFIETWLTPSATGTCWIATVTTLDGSTLAALFSLR